jgi:hypothetical protein
VHGTVHVLNRRAEQQQQQQQLSLLIGHASSVDSCSTGWHLTQVGPLVLPPQQQEGQEYALMQ